MTNIDEMSKLLYCQEYTVTKDSTILNMRYYTDKFNDTINNLYLESKLSVKDNIAYYDNDVFYHNNKINESEFNSIEVPDINYLNKMNNIFSDNKSIYLSKNKSKTINYDNCENKVFKDEYTYSVKINDNFMVIDKDKSVIEKEDRFIVVKNDSLDLINTIYPFGNSLLIFDNTDKSIYIINSNNKIELNCIENKSILKNIKDILIEKYNDTEIYHDVYGLPNKSTDNNIIFYKNKDDEIVSIHKLLYDKYDKSINIKSNIIEIEKLYLNNDNTMNYQRFIYEINDFNLLLSDIDYDSCNFCKYFSREFSRQCIEYINNNLNEEEIKDED